MYHNSINILRINNGYAVTVPMYPKPFEPMSIRESDKANAGKSYIPTNDSMLFFETLDKVFEYLKSIEKTIPMDNFAFGSNQPVLVG